VGEINLIDYIRTINVVHSLRIKRPLLALSESLS